MAQELAETAPADQQIADPEAVSGFMGSLQSLGVARILALGAVAVILLGFFAYIILRATAPSYGVLFSGLTLDDSAVITERLNNLGITYRLSESGDAVLVPRDEVLKVRMDLASEGIPAGGSMGYELFDQSSSLTATDFISNVNLRRALEGELARTISSLRQVRAARVHIVSPSKQPFSRNEPTPTASVVVGASHLTERQIEGIRNLVASAVPGLSAGEVSIIDDQGNLLASPADDSNMAFSQRHEDQRIALEAHLRGKIIALLERSLGRGKVDAQVFADMDFDQLSTTTEEFDPEGQVARSIQSIEENTDIEETENAQDVTVQNNLPAEGQDQNGPTSTEQANRVEESTNFEISRTVQSQTRIGGVIRRLSVAVQVDHIQNIDAEGNITSQPRDANDIEQIESLVRSAVGFDEERGDWIEVVSRAFAEEEIVELEEPSIFEFGKEDIWRIAELVILAMLALAGLAFGIKPLLAYSFGLGVKDEAEKGEATIDGILDANGNPIPLIEDGSGEEMEVEDEDEDLIDVDGITGKVKASLVDKVSEIIESNPEAGVRVLRSWLHGG